MNPYQIVGIIAGCSLSFAGVVALLAMQGVPVMLAFLLVYAIALLSMLGMQQRARQSCEAPDDARDARRHGPTRDVARARGRARARRRHARVRPLRVAAEDLGC